MNIMINVVVVGEVKSYPRYFYNTTVIVQRNCIKPKHHVLIGCFSVKRQESIRGIDKFVNNTLNSSDQMKFYEHFHDELSQTVNFLQKEPLRVYDFQLMIDTNGQIYYLDFDRMIHRNTGFFMKKTDIKRIAECQNHLNDLSQHIDIHICMLPG